MSVFIEKRQYFSFHLEQFGKKNVVIGVVIYELYFQTLFNLNGFSSRRNDFKMQEIITANR